MENPKLKCLPKAKIKKVKCYHTKKLVLFMSTKNWFLLFFPPPLFKRGEKKFVVQL